jgi:hypothetical protein
MDTKKEKTKKTARNKNLVTMGTIAESEHRMLSKIGIYWKTEYRKGWIKDMRAVLK